jgi:hypothetical protein
VTELEPYTDIRDLRNPATDSWTDVLEQVGDLAQRIARTDFVPESFRGNVAATAAAILYGREVGLGPMQSLTTLHNIKGKVGMTAEAMRALVLQAGHELVIVESSSARVTVKGRRKGSEEWSQVTWTIDDARQAKLGGTNWSAYPRQMLSARATAELCRLIFPDAIHGLLAVEELDDSPGDPVAAITTAPTGRTTVQRRRKPAQESTPAPPPPQDEPPLPDTPPPRPAPRMAAEPPPEEPDDFNTNTYVGTAEIGPNGVPAAAVLPLDPAPTKAQPPAHISPQQRAMLMAKFAELDIHDRNERLRILSALAGRTVTSTNNLTLPQASHVIDALATVRHPGELDDLLTIVGEPA